MILIIIWGYLRRLMQVGSHTQPSRSIVRLILFFVLNGLRNILDVPQYVSSLSNHIVAFKTSRYMPSGTDDIHSVKLQPKRERERERERQRERERERERFLVVILRTLTHLLCFYFYHSKRKRRGRISSF